MTKSILRVLTCFALVSCLFAFKSCASVVPNRNPMGEPFPNVAGESLEESAVEIPGAFAGAPVVLLVGYEQETQFDIDRWLMGLLQAEVNAAIVEVPTIPSLVPTLISDWIDDGMREGIPEQDWGSVVTLYGDAAQPVVEFTGNEFGQRARVLLLDAEGRVVYFDDSGYSVRGAMAIAEWISAVGGDDLGTPTNP